MSLRQVDAREAVRDWDYYEPLIARVVERAGSGSTPDDVLTCVQSGDMQLWRIVNDQGLVVTEIQAYPRHRLLLIYMTAGVNALDWMTEGQQQLEAFAKLHSCKYIEFMGRPGWEKYALRYGYGHKLIKMRKEI